MAHDNQTVFQMIGGEATMKELVDRFYAHVETDEELRSMFPDNLEPGKHWQFLFLMQYFGGPKRYMDERGHPRLRMRHMPFPIDAHAARRWLGYMLQAIDETGIQEPARSLMREYFERAAPFMVNTVKPE